MTREEFIIESAMRNMQAFCTKDNTCREMNNYRDNFASTAIGLANAMADYLFPCEDNEEY